MSLDGRLVENLALVVWVIGVVFIADGFWNGGRGYVVVGVVAVVVALWTYARSISRP